MTSPPPSRPITRDPSPDASAVIISVAFFLGIVFSIAFFDRPVAYFAHAHLRQPFFLWLTWLVNPVVPGSLGLLAISSIFWLFGWRPGPLARILIAAAVASLVADEFKTDLKYLFGRAWPETWIEHNPSLIGTGTYGFFPMPAKDAEKWASFPSGHTTLMAAPMAVFWGAMKPGQRLWTLAPPVLVAIGLLGMDYHFLSDCLAGLALGALVGKGIGVLSGTTPEPFIDRRAILLLSRASKRAAKANS